MPAGEAFTFDQRRSIERARADAERTSGLAVHVYVGVAGDDPRLTAYRLHGSLPRHASAVLVLVDPPGRAVEIVTGVEARRWLDDSACALVVLSMQTAFAAGDLAGGLVHGLYQLGDHAAHPSGHVRGPNFG